MTKGRPRENMRVRDEVSVYAKSLKGVLVVLEKRPQSPKEVAETELERAKKANSKPRFSARGVYRYLNGLRYLERAEEREGLWFPLYPIRRAYTTKVEKDDAWEHSKDLVVGLEAILAEGRAGHSDALEVEAFPRAQLPKEFKARQQDVYDYILTKVGDVNRIKQFAEKHLMTGYPLVYGSLEKYRKLLVDIRCGLEQSKHPEKVIRFVVDGIATFPATLRDSEKWPWVRDGPLTDDIKEVLRQKLEAYTELEGKIREIEHYVFAREPLDGQCQACKGIRIVK